MKRLRGFWPEYGRALQQHGSLTAWVAPEALAAWHPPCIGQRGRPRDHSEVAIETGHLLRVAFGGPWRQTEGLLRLITALLGMDVGVPDHTTFSRRSPGLALAASLAQAQVSGPVHVVTVARGLKVYGAGGSLVEKHGERGTRTWRKLHLAVDPDTGEILASELTGNEDGDASQVGPLLGQIAGPITSVTTAGAYDGSPVYHAVAERQPDPPMAVVIPPRSIGAEPSGGHGTRSAPPASAADPKQGVHGVAEGGRLRPAVARGNRHVLLQGPYRQQPLCPDLAGPESQGQGRLLGAEPDDPPRHADVATDCLKRRPATAARPRMHQSPATLLPAEPSNTSSSNLAPGCPPQRRRFSAVSAATVLGQGFPAAGSRTSATASLARGERVFIARMNADRSRQMLLVTINGHCPSMRP